MEKEKSFIGYEYRDVTVGKKVEQIYLDCFESFGWKLDKRESTSTGVNSTQLKYKRNRKINNKNQVVKLQRQFESEVYEIERLEKSKGFKSSFIAYIIGVIGTICITASVFAFINNLVPLSIVMAIPGFIGWIIPYFVYASLKRKKVLEVTPLIDKEFDRIFEICEEANQLLSA